MKKEIGAPELRMIRRATKEGKGVNDREGRTLG
jgi:hypothetical protein